MSDATHIVSEPLRMGYPDMIEFRTESRGEVRLVVVCIPLSWPYVPAQFFKNFFKMVARAIQDGYSLSVTYGRSPFMDTCRDELMSEALRNKARYILFLDADQLYPVDTVSRLARHIDDGKMVVGGITPHKTDGRALIFNWTEDSGWKAGWSQTIGPNQGVVKVGGMGFGGVMVSPKIADLLPYPRFEMIAHPEYHYKIGEDVVFYRNCLDKGIDVWCDTTLLNEHLQTIQLQIKPTDEYTNDIDGWMNPDELLWLYRTAKNMTNVVEIGSWKGKSTHALCSGCKGQVFSVDHFQGTLHEATWKPAHEQDIYPIFLSNVGHFGNLTSIKSSSLEAAPKFEDASIDMVFIDGGHGYEEVLGDIEAWFPKCRRMICGHDYGWTGVKKAVEELIGRVDTIGSIWYKWL
jgi:hypothetical protein